MTDKWKCPFCKHNKPYRDTPYVDRISGEKKQQPCCDKQAKNMEYRETRFHPDSPNKPELDDIAKT